jgi:hypothetical protein
MRNDNRETLQLGEEVFRVHSARLGEALVTAALYRYVRNLKSACIRPRQLLKAPEPDQTMKPWPIQFLRRPLTVH